jgi:hypothetical protein
MLQRRHQLSARRLLRSITAGPRPLADALLLDALLLLPPPHLPRLRFNYLEHFGPSNEMHEMPSALLKDAFGESSDLLFFLYIPAGFGKGRTDRRTDNRLLICRAWSP